MLDFNKKSGTMKKDIMKCVCVCVCMELEFKINNCPANGKRRKQTHQSTTRKKKKKRIEFFGTSIFGPIHLYHLHQCINFVSDIVWFKPKINAAMP